jgi:signal peptidase I
VPASDVVVELELHHSAPEPVNPVISPRRNRIEWIVAASVAIVATILVRWFVFGSFVIPSGSMQPTLNEVGTRDRVLVNKLSYRFGDVGRGDIVVFTIPPGQPPTDIDHLIKRVIGLPGEVIEATGGRVRIDGAPIDEGYINPRCDGTADFGPVQIPNNYVFVMGDNRCDSRDSRVFGPINTDIIVGQAFARLWPLGRLGWL